MRIFFSTILLCAAVIGTASAQPWRDTLWTRTYGEIEHWEEANGLAETTDHGFVLVGTWVGEMHFSPWRRAFLVRTDSTGRELWSISYPNSSLSAPHGASDVALLDSATYLVVGWAGWWPNRVGAVLWIDNSGSVFQSRYLQGAGRNLEISRLIQTPNGDYVLAGTTYFENEAEDIYLTRITSDGDQVWEHIFGSDNRDWFGGLCLSPDGGIIVVGGTSGDVLLFRVEADGSFAWDRSYETAFSDFGWDIKPHPNGGYIVCGDTYHAIGTQGYLIMRVTEDGEIVWTNHSVLVGQSRYMNALAVTPEGEIYAAGMTSSSGWPRYDGYIVKLDESGDTLWTSTYGSWPTEWIHDVVITATGTVAICGYVSSDNPPTSRTDGWLMAISAHGTSDAIPSRPLPRHFDLAAYPNPFNPTTTLRFCLDRPKRVSLVVYDVTGREAARLLDRELPGGEHTVPLDGLPLSSGIYFARLDAASQLQTIKLVLLK